MHPHVFKIGRDGRFLDLVLVPSGIPTPEYSSNQVVLHEDTWKQRKSPVIQRLTSLCGMNKNRIHGRKTKVKKTDRNKARSFIDQHHLMGFGGGKVFLGLYSADDLVAIAAFSKVILMKYETPTYRSAELVRFCSLSGFTVVGGLDKLVQHFLKHYETDDLITYVDKETSDGRSFKRLGFDLIGETEPLHFTLVAGQRKRVEHSEKVDSAVISNQGNWKYRLVKNQMR